MTELHELTAVEAGALLDAKKISSIELVDALLARIERCDGAVNAEGFEDPHHSGDGGFGEETVLPGRAAFAVDNLQRALPLHRLVPVEAHEGDLIVDEVHAKQRDHPRHQCDLLTIDPRHARSPGTSFSRRSRQ